MEKDLFKRLIAEYQQLVTKVELTQRDIHLSDKLNYVLVGLRRAGKSYLLYQQIHDLISNGHSPEEILYFNFEDDRLVEMTLQDLDTIKVCYEEMFPYKPIFFLDEIQNIDGWEKFARRLADSKYRVYITGSNAKMLSKEIQSTLGGRYIAVDVFPYSFEEFLTANNVKISPTTLYGTETRAEVLRMFNDYFSFGGFPEGSSLASKRDYLSSVYQKIYLGDIAARHSIDNTFALKVMFKKIAESVMQPLSFSRLANIITSTGVKVGKSTLINYIEYSKDAWLINQITNFAGKLVDKETNPKYYFTDNGILNLFLINNNAALLENLVAISLLRKYGREDAVFFYNDGVEVDFYIPEAAMAIQVSYTISDKETYEREVKALIKLSNFIECKRLVIITRDEEQTITNDEKIIEVIPVWKWLLAE